VSVTAAESIEIAESALDDLPALWVADTSMWGDYLDQRAGDPLVDNLGSMASSPLVVAAPEPVVEQVGGSAASPTTLAWSQLLGGTASVGIVNPETSTDGLATLAMLESLLGGEPGQAPPENLVRSYVGLSRNVLPSADDAFASAATGTSGAVFATTEQAVLQHASDDGATVLPIYPEEGTVFWDFPVLRIKQPGESAEISDAAQVVSDALLSASATAAAQQAGFRSADGTLDMEGGAPDSVRQDPPPDSGALTLEVAEDALRTWSAVTLEARMLTVIDVSGSMAQDAGQGRTRIELARDAAVTGLTLYPDSAEIGLWAFSELQNPPADWVSLVSLGRLTSEVDGVPRRQALLSAAQTLPSLVEGGTGLYDTTLAAFRTVRTNYDPARINSVLLLTDGRNEDDDFGIDLPTLLRTLRAEFDPAQPVPIITIGMGPDADLTTLSRISEITGGKAYAALDPNDIETVFLDAMIERRCRPEC
jgi:Ca-activated chloride channel homolog